MIELRNLTKSYRVKSGRHYVFNGVNAVFPKGANIGIIGPNGGGKSTFLRILGGIDFPDSGRIDSDCTFSWPLGLKGGFVPHLSGRDNCRMICNLYGLRSRNTRIQLEKIKELAGIGDYFEEPVNYYSSGMSGRLGFALSMSFDFDYFLIDEITAVGDAQFKVLAKNALEEKAKNSRVIMVSHNMGDIKKFCDVGVLLKEGGLTVYEDLDEAIREYLPKTKEAEEDLTELLREARVEELHLQSVVLPKPLQELSDEISDLLSSIESKLSIPSHVITGNEADFYSLLGLSYQQLGHYGAAEKLHRKALEENPYHLRSLQALANLAFRRDDFATETEALEAAEKMDAANIQNRLIRARVDLREQRIEEAVQGLEAILKINPKHASAWNQYAKALLAAGKAEKALDAQIKAVKHAIDSPSLAPQLGLFYSQLSQLLAASSAIELSIQTAYQAFILAKPNPEIRYQEPRRTLHNLDQRISV
jgi:capsular polysaccharide transport system ATP-binding protein